MLNSETITGTATELVNWLFNQDKERLFDIKPHRESRSLTANAYCWALIGKIADSLRAGKDEVYLRMLKRYGQSSIISVLSGINLEGIIKYYEEIGKGTVNGKEFTHYRVYKGSSEYDSREMAILIDGIISEAKELGLETLPAHEIEMLKSKW